MAYINCAYILMLCVSVAWSTPVLAAATFDGQVGEIVSGAYISVTILSLLGGIMRTLYRLNSGTVAVRSPALEFAVNIFAGEVAGWLMYMVTSTASLGPVGTVPAIFAASAAAPFFIQKWLPDKFGVDIHYPGEVKDTGKTEEKEKPG